MDSIDIDVASNTAAATASAFALSAKELRRLTLYSAATIAVVGANVVQIAVSSPKPVDPALLATLSANQVRRIQGQAGP